jgi:hypothetical protein
MTQKNAVLIYFAAEASNQPEGLLEARYMLRSHKY